MSRHVGSVIVAGLVVAGIVTWIFLGTTGGSSRVLSTVGHPIPTIDGRAR